MIRALVLATALAFSGFPGAAAQTCAVDDATLTWGFKESFRSYISGTIANGGWTVADGATYETPDFGWTGGTGDLQDSTGTIAFTGAITFTGHGGILNTTVANPRLRFDGTGTATLLLDVSGTTQEGQPVDERAVEFATIDLAILEEDDRAFLTEARTVLTEAGAAAFGTYPAGEELDPISATLPTKAGCGPMFPAAEPEGDGYGQILAVVGAVFAGIVALVAASAVLVVVLLARRRKRATPEER